MPKRILVVDDEENMRRTLTDILQEEGYVVTAARSGEQALAMSEQASYDVALLDVRMPGMNGVEAARRLRSLQDTVRIIFMSAYTNDMLQRQAFEEGAVAFLSKPLDLDHVLQLIGAVHDTSILVIEHQADRAEALQAGLRQRGFRAQAVRTSSAALKLAEQVRFDVALLDAHLPEMKSLDLYLAVKGVSPSTVAIMMCEASHREVAREAVRRTAYAVVDKPLDLEALTHLLERVKGQRLSGHLHKPGLSP